MEYVIKILGGSFIDVSQGLLRSIPVYLFESDRIFRDAGFRLIKRKIYEN